MSHAHREGPRAKDRPNVARSDVLDVGIFLRPLALVGSTDEAASPDQDGRALNRWPLGMRQLSPGLDPNRTRRTWA
jgi:hypothetical protein